MTHSSRRFPYRRALSTLAAGIIAATSVVGAPIARLVPPATAQAAGSFTDPHFADFTVFSGLDHPTTVRFADDGRAFVAEKGGVVKEFDSTADTTPTTVIDISGVVMNYWDRGLLGLAIDPAFLTGRPYLYLFYVYNVNAVPSGVPATWPDNCPNPPGGTTDGCPVTSHLDRIEVNPTTNVAVPNSRTNLLADWCQQYPSHSGGGLRFGTDGQLYLSTGDGASFNGMDYGQRGGTLPDTTNPVTPMNACGDPVTGSVGAVNVATAEGGMLRSQDIRTGADPLGLDGTVIRIDPDTGLASPGNPLASQTDPNAKRIVATGFRNPYRFTFRPGTNDLYLGDVGNGTWEEIERLIVPSTPKTPTTLPNFGWPCYEGVARQGSFESLNTNMCASIYAQSGAVTSPLYQYSHTTATGASTVGPCYTSTTGSQSSSVTGLAFYEGPVGDTTPYPAKYDGALFFADYSRNCLAAILPGSNGLPDPTKMEQVGIGVAQPVDLLTGPDGDLYYVDHTGGRVMRVRYLVSPVARATADPLHSVAPTVVHLDGTGSTDPNDGVSIDGWSWDLDNNGTFETPGGTYDWSISTPGTYPVTLKVHSTSGLTDTTTLLVDATNAPPDPPVIESPPASLTWAVGDTIEFAGSAHDGQDGDLPASSLDWTVIMEHCPSDCHEHTVETQSGVASGSFVAPDHEYPSHLRLRLTATDSEGLSTSSEVDLQPKTATIHVDSTPAAIPITIDSVSKPAPWTATVIKGGSANVNPPLTRTIGGKRYRFSTWDDTHQRVRNLVADANISLATTYVRDAPDTCATTTTSSPKRTWLSERTSGYDDEDWFEFHLDRKRKVVITVVDLPVNLRLGLYRSCSNRLAGSNAPGTQTERLTRTLSAGWYRVRVRAVNEAAWSPNPYRLKIQPTG